eukprot:c1929_g1_i1.p1 GENE.c1929_g1_i1~~c1929_g1_i1.p1  ORF type:complete len:564 (-),score=90.38 c1929_g1_i1:46-1737(-)
MQAPIANRRSHDHDDQKAFSFSERPPREMYERHLTDTKAQGWLEKFNLDRWEKFWYSLENGVLSYSRRPTSEKCGEIKVSELQSVRISEFERGFELRMRKSFRKGMKLRTCEGSCPEEVNKWLLAFHRSVVCAVNQILLNNEGIASPQHGFEDEERLCKSLGNLSTYLFHNLEDHTLSPLGSPPMQPSVSSDDEEDEMFAFEEDKGSRRKPAPHQILEGCEPASIPFARRVSRSHAPITLPAASSPLPQHENVSRRINTTSSPSGFFACQGVRSYMEDVCFVVPNCSGCVDRSASAVCALGVFDGHSGNQAALFAAEWIPRLLLESKQLIDTQTSETLAEIFADCDRKFLDIAERDSVEAGTTALVCLVFPNRVVVANAGDCRAVLCRDGVAMDLSQEHKPDRDDERRRVESAGGWITIEQELELGNLKDMRLRDAQVRDLVEQSVGYVTVSRVNGELGVSRGLGDFRFKGSAAAEHFNKTFTSDLVISTPEICEVALDSGDEFVLLASDGLWDVFSSQEAVELVRKCCAMGLSPQEICTEVVHSALERGSLDNTSVVYMALR